MRYNEKNFVSGFENSQFIQCFKIWLLSFRFCVYLEIGFEASGSILYLKNLVQA